MVAKFGDILDILFGIFFQFRKWYAGICRGMAGVVWKRDRVHIVRRVLVHDRDPMMTHLARNPEAASFPVYRRIKPHEEWYTKYQVVVHRGNPEVQVELHGMHLGINMHELGIRDFISIRHFECLAIMQLVQAQIQFVGDMFGDKI